MGGVAIQHVLDIYKTYLKHMQEIAVLVVDTAPNLSFRDLAVGFIAFRAR